MTSIYKGTTMVPVTVVELEEGNIVTQIRRQEEAGYNAVQVGYRVVPGHKITKPERNHLAKAGAPPMKFLREFRVRGRVRGEGGVGQLAGYRGAGRCTSVGFIRLPVQPPPSKPRPFRCFL